MLAVMVAGLSIFFICVFLAVQKTHSVSPLSGKDAVIMGNLKRHVEARLKDPDSTVYRNLTFYEDSFRKRDPSQKGASYTLCGELNAKNSMGGYSGYTGFVSTEIYWENGEPMSDSNVVFLAPDDDASEDSRKNFEKTAQATCIGDKLAITSGRKEER